MSVDLQKRAQDAQDSIISLLKEVQSNTGQDPGEISAQVILAIDYSGSMDFLYTRGVVQSLAERGVALAIAGLDDDGNIQIVMFHHDSFEPFTVDASNYPGVIQRWRDGEDPTAAPRPDMSSPGKGKGLFRRRAPRPSQAVVQPRQMGGTDYLPAIRRIRRMISEDLDPKAPSLVLFFTDGQTGNQEAIKRELIDARKDPIFWQFVGLGYLPAFINDLDKPAPPAIDNVGVFEVPANADQLSDPDFYTAVTKEYITKWTPAARRAGIL